MNGYSTRAKNERVGLGCGDCCKRAFLSALVHTGGSLVFARGGMKIVISAGAKGIKNKVEKYALEMLDGVTVSGTDGETVIGGSGLTAALYALGIFRKSDEGETKVEEGIPHAIVAERCCGVNYLRGAFLGAGSLYIGKGYHLEFAVESKALAEDLRALLDRYGIAAKIIDRKKNRSCISKTARA
ncbi:MAG: DNA-binding protein WhiA [Christensenellales bacterium]